MRIWALALLTALLAGCAGSGDGDHDRATPATDDQGRYVIRLVDNQFVPKHSMVPSGATVLFLNEDTTPEGHNVDGYYDGGVLTFSSLDDPPAGHGDYFHTPGEAWAYTFTRDGTYSVACHPHHESHEMLGTIRVG